jgi:hypothetical protein
MDRSDSKGGLSRFQWRDSISMVWGKEKVSKEGG